MSRFINSFSQLTRPTQNLLVLVSATVLFFGIVAYASIPDANGIIHGCYKRTGGQLRVIDGPASSCDGNELPIQWGETGPPGTPAPPRLITIGTGSGTFASISCGETVRSKDFVKQSETTSLRITYHDSAHVSIVTAGGVPSYVVEIRVDGSAVSPTPIYSLITGNTENAATSTGFTSFGYANGIPAGTHTISTHYSGFSFQPSNCFRGNAYTIEIEEISF